MKRHLTAVIVTMIFAALVAGCSQKKAEDETVSVTELRKAEGKPVKVITLEVKQLPDTIQVSGTVEVPNEVHMTPKVGGEVIAIYKDKGDSVKVGEPLLQVDKDDYQIAYRQAKAAYDMATQQLEMAKTGARSEELQQASDMMDQAEAAYDVMKKNYQRTEELYEEGVASRQQLDTMEVQLVSAEKQYNIAKKQLEMAKTGARPEEIKLLEAQVDQARAAKDNVALMLERTTVKSTVDGVISYRFFMLGESIGPNNPIYQILEDGPKKITFTINEKDINRVHEGDIVDFKVSGMNGDVFKAKITYISQFVRKMTREAELEAELIEEPQKLSHGMFVEGEITVGIRDLLVAPYKAAIDNRFLYVVGTKKPEGEETEITVANQTMCEGMRRVEEFMSIPEGCVEAGQQIVAEGQGILDDGDKIKIMEQMEY